MFLVFGIWFLVFGFGFEVNLVFRVKGLGFRALGFERPFFF